jgi:hypothetical protein
VPPEKIMKAFHQMLSANGKTKFKHWFYDLGYKYAIVICLYSFSLFFSVLIPLILPFATLIFAIFYYIDKYNLLYIYPLEFESKPIYRKALVVYTILAIIVF